MGLKSWIVLAAEILSSLAGMELVLTLGGNVMDDQIVEIKQMRTFASVVDAGWESFGVEVGMSACQRGGGVTGGLTAEMVAMRLAVHLQMGST